MQKQAAKKRVAGVVIAAAVIAAVLLWVFWPKSDSADAYAQELQQQTITLTDVYYEAQIMTHKVLHADNTQVDYQTWYRGMEKACRLWQDVENECAKLDNVCGCAAGQQDGGHPLEEAGEAVGSLFSVRTAYAYSAEQISAVFDAAPAGQRLKKLAAFLGTDAKTAYQVLKGTQAEVTQQAYADEDFYRKCETAAVVIKDAAKVGFFAGSIALSGGLSASFSAVEGAAIIAGGTDLMLEIYEDHATIAYGEGNDTTMVIKDLRKGTKPLAAILGLSNLASHAIDQLGYLSDSTLSLFQNDEVLGFCVRDKKDLQKLKMSGMDYADIAYWAGENGVNLDWKNSPNLTLKPEDVEDVDVAVPEAADTQPAASPAVTEPAATQPAATEPAATVPPEETASASDFDLDTFVLGTWESIDYWAGDMDETGHYTNYTVDNKGYTYFLRFAPDGSAVYDERHDATGEICEGVWAFQYVVDGSRINFFENGTLMYTLYYNAEDGIIYCVDPQMLTTNGTYRTFIKR